MVMVTSEIPAMWWWGLAAVWTVVASFLTIKGGWLSMPERSEAFPFSARQFFLMTLALLAAFALYLCSFNAAVSIITAFRRLSISTTLGTFSANEWQAMVQLVGLVLGTLSILLVTYVVPNDLRDLVCGKSGGVKQWLKGCGFGIVFMPIILLSTWVIGVLTSLFGPEKAPQLALDILASLHGKGVLFWLLVIFVVVVVPYVEEMLFRGYLQGFLNGLVHPTLAVFLTSAAFSAFHYTPTQKASNVEIMVGLFVFSLFASKLRYTENSIHAAIGMHTAFNAASLLLFFETM
jgi:membrane protease YdiL (CAAX protease family)